MNVRLNLVTQTPPVLTLMGHIHVNVNRDLKEMEPYVMISKNVKISKQMIVILELVAKMIY